MRWSILLTASCSLLFAASAARADGRPMLLPSQLTDSTGQLGAEVLARIDAHWRQALASRGFALSQPNVPMLPGTPVASVTGRIEMVGDSCRVVASASGGGPTWNIATTATAPCVRNASLTYEQRIDAAVDDAADQLNAAIPAAAPPPPPPPSDLPIATEGPHDWAGAHVGVRPNLDRFIGVGTLALAHGKVRRFYGVVALSGVRNDADQFVGVTQLTFGRNSAEKFYGVTQIALTENDADRFRGVAQVSPALNEAKSFGGLAQIGSYNRAENFGGVAQAGPYNRVDKDIAALAQVGAYNRVTEQFSGGFQIGAVNSADSFEGLAQISFGLNYVGKDAFADGFGESEERAKKRRFAGLFQIGVVNGTDGGFVGIAQIGAGNAAGNFTGFMQLGYFANYTQLEVTAPLQMSGVVNYAGKSFTGLAQITGGANIAGEVRGLQIAGFGNVTLGTHEGAQIATLNYAKEISGAQIGLANGAANVSGIQIGLFNHAKRLRGLQIGLVNHAEEGGLLPWSGIINMGFGPDDSSSSPRAVARR